MSTTVLAAVDFGSTVTDGVRTVTTFIPKLLGFLIILIVGYFIARIVAKVVDKVLDKVGFDKAVEKGPVRQALSKSEYDASDIVSKLVFYAIFIPFLAAAVGTLGIAALVQPLNAFILLIPKIIVAVIIVVVGGVVAGAVKKLVEGALGGLSYGKVLANALSFLVILIFIKAALDQVGIATTVTGSVLIAVLATVAGILIVGVGGALIKPLQGRLETALTKASSEAAGAKEQVKSNSESSAQPSGTGSYQSATPAGPGGPDSGASSVRFR
jgi:hypothetical protein